MNLEKGLHLIVRKGLQKMNSGQTITYEPNIAVYDINKIDNNSIIVVGRFKSKKCNNIVMIDSSLNIIQSF